MAFVEFSRSIFGGRLQFSDEKHRCYEYKCRTDDQDIKRIG